MEADITQFIQKPFDDPNKLASIEAKIAEIEKSKFGVEESALEFLKQEKLKYAYPVLSPEFLNLTQETGGVVHWKDWTIEYIARLPYFCVYQLENPQLGIGMRKDYFERNSYRLTVMHRSLPQNIVDHYVKNIDMTIAGVPLSSMKKGKSIHNGHEDGFFIEKVHDHLPKELRKPFKKGWPFLAHYSSCQCVIPPDVKEKMLKEKSTFSAILIGAKTPGEDWTPQETKRFVPEPFLIGVHDETIYYLGSFKSVPLGNYVTG